MSNIIVSDIQVVGATDGEITHYFAAAVPRDKAEATVQGMLDEGWAATLTNRHLTLDQAAKLNIRPGQVKRLELEA
jgi:hypothetical protein